jgi:hypothetical protein
MIRWLRRNIDAIEVFYGLLPEAAGYMAFVSWASLIVRAIRGEDAKEDWRTFVSSAAFISTRALVRSGRVRQAEALRDTATEVRELVREAAEDAKQRDRRAAEQQDRLTRLTKSLVLLAALTLAAAVVTLVVAIVI